MWIWVEGLTPSVPDGSDEEGGEMGFFTWAAPMFHRADKRWTDDDIEVLAGWLRPFVGVGGRLLDVGGGTGAVAVRLSRALDAHVTVLDPTPEMVRYVPTDAGVEVVLGEAEAMPLADNGFDAIFVNDALHHFRNQSAALGEFARVIRPGGGVLVLELDPRGLGMHLLAGVERLLGEPGAFLLPDAMVALMAEHDIAGVCIADRGPSYHFLGSAG